MSPRARRAAPDPGTSKHQPTITPAGPSIVRAQLVDIDDAETTYLDRR